MVGSEEPHHRKLDQQLLLHWNAETFCWQSLCHLDVHAVLSRIRSQGRDRRHVLLALRPRSRFFPNGSGLLCDKAHEYDIGTVHYVFAAFLFSTLAYFCLVLFKMTAQTKQVTRKKLQRNQVYTGCGYVIIASMLLIIVLKKILKVEHLVGNFSPTFCFESTALIAFGIAWLTKGETFLKDENPEPSTTQTAAKI